MGSKSILFISLFLALTVSLSAAKLRGSNSSSIEIPSYDRGMPTEQYLAYHQYPYEAHWVTTEDGYILKYNRIQAKYSTIQPNKPPILLHHGLLDCSDTWIINDETLAPAFIFANAGYDVWMGNSRGNMFGRNHTNMSPSDPAFWNFTFTDMGMYDLPAGFSYIANQTGIEKIDYVGHSQGSTIMFVALTQRQPTVLRHLKKYFAFGPVARVQNVTSEVFLAMAKYNVDVIFKVLGFHEVFAYNWIKHPILENFCGFFGKFCRSFLKPISDTDPELDNYRIMNTMVGHDPAGTSLKNMEHWKQMMKSGKFQGYDYGTVGNLKTYGTINPPKYDLTKIEETVHLFAGSSDSLADPIDVAYLRTQLKHQWFKEYNSGHVTFVWGLNSYPTYDVLGLLGFQN